MHERGERLDPRPRRTRMGATRRLVGRVHLAIACAAAIPFLILLAVASLFVQHPPVPPSPPITLGGPLQVKVSFPGGRVGDWSAFDPTAAEGTPGGWTAHAWAFKRREGPPPSGREVLDSTLAMDRELPERLADGTIRMPAGHGEGTVYAHADGDVDAFWRCTGGPRITGLRVTCTGTALDRRRGIQFEILLDPGHAEEGMSAIRAVFGSDRYRDLALPPEALPARP